MVTGPRTSTSVLRSPSWKAPDRLAFMVSVNTSEPAMKATPSSTAVTVESSRRLCARIPRSA